MASNVTTETELQQKIGSLIFSLKSEREKRKLEREESILSMRLERQNRKQEIASMLSSISFVRSAKKNQPWATVNPAPALPETSRQ
jgi:hypothetical protein